jgi:glycosyltransferase involved in cell wall biosynthesis
MQIALVHDWLNQLGGAEAVLETLVDMFPRAPIYTSIYWRQGMPPFYQGWDIHTSWLDRAPGIHRHHQPYLPLYPPAWTSINLNRFDLILSNKSGFCHGVRTSPRRQSKPRPLHICYCLAPTRYVWNFEDYIAQEGLGQLATYALKPLIGLLRRWDYAAAQRVDHFIAISHEIQDRIKRYYNRESIVIHPPVDIRHYAPQKNPGDYYLIVSRLIPYKRIDLAIEAFNQLGLPLVIGGDGRDRARLQKLARPNIKFLGRVLEADLPDLVARCRAFIFPGHEDFGLAPVEAQAAGRPVIAFGAGGALDTVIDGQTGVLFQPQTAEALAEAVQRCHQLRFDQKTIRANAEKFSASVFKEKLGQFIQEKYLEHSQTAARS